MSSSILCSYSFFFFNDTATTEIYTLSLHDALPICLGERRGGAGRQGPHRADHLGRGAGPDLRGQGRSEEHTSELQSRPHLVCRLLLEKKKNTTTSREQNDDKSISTQAVSGEQTEVD